jgi:hypothetical protein
VSPEEIAKLSRLLGAVALRDQRAYRELYEAKVAPRK